MSETVFIQGFVLVLERSVIKLTHFLLTKSEAVHCPLRGNMHLLSDSFTEAQLRLFCLEIARNCFIHKKELKPRRGSPEQVSSFPVLVHI